MFGYNPSKQALQMFEAQFEPRGDGYAYRKTLKGPPIPVSAEERQRFIEAYVRQRRLAKWLMIGAWIAIVIFLIAWSIATGTELSNGALLIAIGATGVGFVAYSLWSWGAPARELARRTPIGHERSKTEFRRSLLKKKSYGELIGVTVFGLFAALSLASENWSSAWGKLWAGGGLIILVGMSVQMFLKWRYEREEARRGH